MKIRYKNKVNAYFQYLMHTSSFSVFDRIVLGLLSFFSYIYGWGVQYIRGSYVQGKKSHKESIRTGHQHREYYGGRYRKNAVGLFFCGGIATAR